MNVADVQELLEELEENQTFVSGARVFNKPSLISISSADREPEDVNQTPYSQVAFSSFAVNLPRPALDVDSIQLVSSNLPMCNNNIPDTACAFWYYRVSAYSGFYPNSNNLFMNRLLPSYYKPELIDNAALFAFNKTFANYAALSTELAKASSTDLAYYNWVNVSRPGLEGVRLDQTLNTYIPFRPNDFLVSYNSTLNKFQGTGNGVAPAVAAYNSGTTYALGAVVATPLAYVPYVFESVYALGDIVIQNFVLYRSLVNGNTGNYVNDDTKWKNIGDLCFWNRPQTWKSLQASNTNHPPASSPTFWQEIGVEYVQPWDADTAYFTGRYVTYSGVTYESTAPVFNSVPNTLVGWKVSTREFFYRYLITGPRDPNVPPAQAGANLFDVDIYPFLQWNQYGFYEVGDRVQYNGQLWRCIRQISGSWGYSDADRQNLRVSVPQQVDTVWDAITSYDAGDIVRYRGIVYKALVIVSVYDPENYPQYWEQIGYWGWDNCEWRSDVTYYQFDAVIYQGITYSLAAESSMNEVPPSGGIWEQIDPDEFSAPAYGLYSTSATFDFIEQSGPDLLIPFPSGIQAQPFTPNPKRLLNSITGFTFNGIFNPSAFKALEDIATERVIPSQITSLFNRTRPVPIYDETAANPPLTLKDEAATATRVYTADGYCNLVYSSIISTYCDIVGASSLDTQRTTNLLAVNTMNCGNLGISFYAPFIDNPLTKMQNDIFTIFVEFRDEFGDLYYFTNNAVVTLTFKVTYKK